MANFITDLVTYVDSQLGSSWTAGTNLFYDSLPPVDSTVTPAIPAAVIAFWNQPIGKADRYQTTKEAYIRIQSRAATRATSLTNWNSVKNLLAGGNHVLTNYTIFFTENLNAEPYLVEDEKGFKIYEGVLYFNYRDNT